MAFALAGVTGEFHPNFFAGVLYAHRSGIPDRQVNRYYGTMCPSSIDNQQHHKHGLKKGDGKV